MTWHVDGDTLEGYLDGHLTEALACSLEAHLLACAQCRADLAAATTVRGRQSHERSWDRLMDQVDRPTGNRIVRVLEKWVPSHLLRLVAAAPALRNAACAAGFAMLAAAVLAANFRSGPLGTLAFLITAPVVP